MESLSQSSCRLLERVRETAFSLEREKATYLASYSQQAGGKMAE